MDTNSLIQRGPCEWEIPQAGQMRVPAVIYATKALVCDMDEKVREQAVNVASLPGIVGASYVMPDAHWGYGFPIGGVAAFDARQGGVISAGGVGFDVSCGVRCLHTGLTLEDILPVQRQLADALFAGVPAGLGSRGAIQPQRGADARHAGRWRALGGRPRLGRACRPGAHRGGRPDAARQARQRVRPGEKAAARGDGHARQRQPLPGSAGSGRDLRVPRLPRPSASNGATSS